MIAEYTWRGAHIYNDDKSLDIKDFKFYFNSQTGTEYMYEVADGSFNAPDKIKYSFDIKNSHQRFVDINRFIDYCESRVNDETSKIGRCDDGYDYIMRNFYEQVGSSVDSVKKYINDKSHLLSDGDE